MTRSRRTRPCRHAAGVLLATISMWGCARRTPEPGGNGDPATGPAAGIDGSRLGARSDCNQCGGSYTLSNGSFAVGPLACTRAYCGDQSLDTVYSGILGEARSLQMDGETLIVGSNGGTLWYTR